MDIKENLKSIIDKVDYGQVVKIAMQERGAYAVSEVQGDVVNMTLFDDFAAKYLSDQEDLTVVHRKDSELALTSTDFLQFIGGLEAPKHIIFVACLELGTTEIKGFLNALLSTDGLENSKVILLDLPQLEYMALRSSMKGKLAL
ncbi:hypothetical protein GHK52_03970 [Lactococcus garvieae]|nr:hypothetical protein [Lactococcus garvieae]